MSNSETVVKLTSDALVVSFQNADTPSIWRAKSDSLDAVSFKLKKKGKTKTVLICSKGGEEEDIAEFTSKAKAEQAFSAISDAVFNMDAASASTSDQSGDAVLKASKSQDTNPAEKNDKPRSMTGWRVLYWVAFVLIFLILVSFIRSGQNTIPLKSADGQTQMGFMPEKPNRQTMGGSVDELPDLHEGRPVPADELFK
tara:strand:+ start:39 stop:632 length:594 start_codon:yes stop_codon:yes gene_type:complete